MKTKDRILKMALKLFNEQGVKEVSLRQIARAVNMSQGNLNYHFKTKADLVKGLYFSLVSEMDEAMQSIAQKQPILKMLYQSSLVSMQTLYNYKFITQDIFSVLASSTEIKAHYLNLQALRKQQFLALFQQMIQEGLLREPLVKNEYERLYERMQILGDNWMSTAALFGCKSDEAVPHYHALLFEVVFPYLTEQGRKEYTALV